MKNTSSSEKIDVVIIGGGIVGCSTAYYLARKGIRVIVVEKDSAVGLQASGRNAGGVRQHGRRASLPMAMEAVQLWATLSNELQSDLEYQRKGNLKVALTAAQVADLEEETAWERAHGLDDVKMVTRAECFTLVAGLTEQALAGKLCATDGVANPMLVTPAFARAAQQLGAEIRTKTTVTGVLRQGSAVRGVMTDAGEIEAEIVVNAAGPWASKFSAMVDCSTPIEARLSQLMITERLPRRVRPWLYVIGVSYLQQTLAGNVVIGIGGQPTDGYDMQVIYQDITLKAERVGGILPWLQDVNLIRTFAGITEYPPDGEPYIGAVSGVPGFFIAAGFHGEGFCTGPMAGKNLANLITGDQPNMSLAPFKPDRFV